MCNPFYMSVNSYAINAHQSTCNTNEGKTFSTTLEILFFFSPDWCISETNFMFWYRIFMYLFVFYYCCGDVVSRDFASHPLHNNFEYAEKGALH